MIKVFGEAFLLGLSTGIFCLGWCSPLLISVIFSDRLSFKKSLGAISEFISGRLIAYIALGGVIGYLGNKLPGSVVQTFSAVSIIIFSMLFLLNGISGIFPDHQVCKLLIKFPVFKRFPLISGILIGLNICPPFLLAVATVVSIGEALKGFLFFLSFFLATSLYIAPFIFASGLSKFNFLRLIAKLSATISGGLFWI